MRNNKVSDLKKRWLLQNNWLWCDVFAAISINQNATVFQYKMCHQRCLTMNKIQSLALLCSFPCDSFAATSTTKQNLENRDGRWYLSWKPQATCLPQLNYDAPQPKWCLNTIRFTLLRRVCRYLVTLLRWSTTITGNKSPSNMIPSLLKATPLPLLMNNNNYYP